MEWRMDHVEVGISKKGMILIEQETAHDRQVVAIHPTQIETVCRWLREARDEAVEALKSGELPEPEENDAK